MTALVVRDKATGKLVCMGPANGMYDPGFDHATQTKGEEPDYDRLLSKHAADLAAQPKPLTLEERVAALEAKV